MVALRTSFATIVGTREYMFTNANLPNMTGDFLSDQWVGSVGPGKILLLQYMCIFILVGETVYNFYGANLQRLWGGNITNPLDYTETWAVRATTRMQSWGFNTIVSSIDQAFAQRRQSYIPIFTTFSVPNSEFTAYFNCNGGKTVVIIDVWDHQWYQAVLNVFTSWNESFYFAKDPFAIGTYIDDEIPW